MSFEFRRAAVIGTGMMGPGIAVTLARGGLDATILSRTPEGAERGRQSALRLLGILVEHGLASSGLEERIRASADMQSEIEASDVIIESAPENMEFKQELFEQLDYWAKPSAVLTSNTSGLSITSIAERCRHPERVLTTHFWNPPHLMPLVEVVKGQRTSNEAAEAVRQLLTRCGKVAVLVKKDTPGQLGNRLQFALFREAIHILQEGIAGVEEIDLAAKCGFGLRLPVYGILEHQDIVGADVGLSILDYVAPSLNADSQAPDLLRNLVAEGKTGAKSGAGFYDWSVKSADAVRKLRDDFVLEMVKSLHNRKSGASPV